MQRQVHVKQSGGLHLLGAATVGRDAFTKGLALQAIGGLEDAHHLACASASCCRLTSNAHTTPNARQDTLLHRLGHAMHEAFMRYHHTRRSVIADRMVLSGRCQAGACMSPASAHVHAVVLAGHVLRGWRGNRRWEVPCSGRRGGCEDRVASLVASCSGYGRGRGPAFVPASSFARHRPGHPGAVPQSPHAEPTCSSRRPFVEDAPEQKVDGLHLETSIWRMAMVRVSPCWEALDLSVLRRCHGLLGHGDRASRHSAVCGILSACIVTAPMCGLKAGGAGCCRHGRQKRSGADLAIMSGVLQGMLSQSAADASVVIAGIWAAARPHSS